MTGLTSRMLLGKKLSWKIYFLSSSDSQLLGRESLHLSFLFFFPHCTAWRPSYTYMYTFFPPLFVLLRCKYLDKVLNATQQDLIVNPFQVASENPKLPIPPTPSLSPWAATSLFSKSMIFFSVEIFICALY